MVRGMAGCGMAVVEPSSLTDQWDLCLAAPLMSPHSTYPGFEKFTSIHRDFGITDYERCGVVADEHFVRVLQGRGDAQRNIQGVCHIGSQCAGNVQSCIQRVILPSNNAQGCCGSRRKVAQAAFLLVGGVV